jgi:chaperonin GroES
MAKGDKAAVLKPLDDRVVVQVLEAEVKTAGGILLPDNAQQKPQQGKIVAIGAGRLLDSGARAPFSVAVGDTVLFAKYGGSDVEVEGVEYKIMREGELLAKVGK